MRRIKRLSANVWRKTASFALAGAIVTSSLFSSYTLATPIVHGDFSGTTVDYLDVTEDTNTGDAQPLFGMPTISGDSLDFNPIGFSASASGASGVDQTDGQLFFKLQAKPGKAIPSMIITEAGDTTLTGFGGAGTFTAVTGLVTLEILETTAGARNVNAQTTMTFNISDGDFDQAADGGGGPLYSTNWNGSAPIDFDAILASNGFSGEQATLVTINLDNVLSAISEDGTVATIAKKDVDSSGLTIDIVPEPTSALLACIGMLAIVTGRRRS